MAVDWSGTAPGVASSVASITQALAAINNMKFQRLLQLASEQREDKQRQDEMAFRAGLSQQEHRNRLSEIEATGNKEVEVAKARYKASASDPSNAPVNTATMGQLLQGLPGAEKLTENMMNNPQDLSPSIANSFADIARTQIANYGDMQEVDARGKYGVKEQNIISARSEKTADAREELERIKAESKASLEQQKQNYRLQVRGVQAQLNMASNDYKNAIPMAEGLIKQLIEVKDRQPVMFWKDKTVKKEADESIKALDAALATGDPGVVQKALKRTRNAYGPLFDEIVNSAMEQDGYTPQNGATGNQSAITPPASTAPPVMQNQPTDWSGGMFDLPLE